MIWTNSETHRGKLSVQIQDEERRLDGQIHSTSWRQNNSCTHKVGNLKFRPPSSAEGSPNIIALVSPVSFYPSPVYSNKSCVVYRLKQTSALFGAYRTFSIRSWLFSLISMLIGIRGNFLNTSSSWENFLSVPVLKWPEGRRGVNNTYWPTSSISCVND